MFNRLHRHFTSSFIPHLSIHTMFFSSKDENLPVTFHKQTMSNTWTATDNDCGQEYDGTNHNVTSPKDKGIRVTLDKASQRYNFLLQVAYVLNM